MEEVLKEHGWKVLVGAGIVLFVIAGVLLLSRTTAPAPGPTSEVTSSAAMEGTPGDASEALGEPTKILLPEL